jgi:hypothetical protein
MKWNLLYQITAASRTPDLGVTAPRSPFSLSSTEFVEPPPRIKFLATPLKTTIRKVSGNFGTIWQRSTEATYSSENLVHTQENTRSSITTAVRHYDQIFEFFSDELVFQMRLTASLDGSPLKQNISKARNYDEPSPLQHRMGKKYIYTNKLQRKETVGASLWMEEGNWNTYQAVSKTNTCGNPSTRDI